jgi:hypothetical protein
VVLLQLFTALVKDAAQRESLSTFKMSQWFRKACLADVRASEFFQIVFEAEIEEEAAS